MSKTKVTILLVIAIAISSIVSAYMFSDTQARSFLKINNCENTCLNPNELIGLIASVGIQKASGLMPLVVKETDKTIVINHPDSTDTFHYVIIPKKDIKNIGELTVEDAPYLIDAI